MENINDCGNVQLEEMRKEMKELQTTLQQQKIFTEKSLRQAMGHRSSWITRFVMIEVIGLPFLILLFLGMKEFVGLSWGFVIASILFVTVDAVWDAIINRLRVDDYISLSLIELQHRLIRQRKMRRIQMLIEVPLVVVWALWFVYDLHTHGAGLFEGVSIWVPLITTALLFCVALAICFRIYNKMQNTDSHMLAEIDELNRMNQIPS